MSFIDSLLGRGRVRGTIAVRNAPQNRELLLLTVRFAPSGLGQPPPHPMPIPAEVIDSWPAVVIKNQAFETSLAAGRYHLLVSWTRYVIDGVARKMILDSEVPDAVWATKLPILVEKGEALDLSLTPDFYDLMRAHGMEPPPPGQPLVLPDTPLRR